MKDQTEDYNWPKLNNLVGKTVEVELLSNSVFVRVRGKLVESKHASPRFEVSGDGRIEFDTVDVFSIEGNKIKFVRQ